MVWYDEKGLSDIINEEYFFKNKKIILNKLKSIDINEFLLHKIIDSIEHEYSNIPHNLVPRQILVRLELIDKKIKYILALYEDLSKDMFIYMMFSKEGLLNNEN